MRYWMNQGTTMRFHNIAKDIEYCSRYGFEAIELKYNSICNLDQVMLKGLLQRYKVGVGSIGALQMPVLQENSIKFQMEKKLKAICQCAYVLGAEHITVIPPRGMRNAEWERVEEESVNILDKYSDIVSDYNLKLAVEVMGFSDSYIKRIEEGLKIVNRVRKDNVGLIYDFYHVLGMRDLGKAILGAKPEKLYIVHINDGMKCDVGEYSDENRLWPCDGELDIKNQMWMLQKIGYQGPFSMEVYQAQKWSYDMQECYRIAQNRMGKIERLYQYDLNDKGEQYDSGME